MSKNKEDHVSNYYNILRSFKEKIADTEAELESFRKERVDLKSHIADVLEENQRLTNEIKEARYSSSSSGFNNHDVQKFYSATDNIKSTNDNTVDDATTTNRFLNAELKCAKDQLAYITKANFIENNQLKNIQKCSTFTIRELEEQIKEHQKYLEELNEKKQQDVDVKEKNEIIIEQRRKIIDQAEHLNEIHQKNVQLKEELEKLKGKRESFIEKLEKKVTYLEKENEFLTRSLCESKTMLEKHFKSENCALTKLHEALVVAETAINDKELAQRREKIIKEECDNLALTIGQVMDEAAKKVHHDMSEMHRKFTETEKSLVEAQNRLKEEIVNQKLLNEDLKSRCLYFNDALRKTKSRNNKLVNDLKIATDNLAELKELLHNKQQLLEREKDADKLAIEHDKQIQQFIQMNNDIKKKYETTLRDLTLKFEKLRNENEVIKEENKNLRAKVYAR